MSGVAGPCPNAAYRLVSGHPSLYDTFRVTRKRCERILGKRHENGVLILIVSRAWKSVKGAGSCDVLGLANINYFLTSAGTEMTTSCIVRTILSQYRKKLVAHSEVAK